MSGVELLVVIGGLALGFWVVSLFINKREGTPPAPHPRAAERGVPDMAWHTVLEISPLASADEIRAAYRSLMSQYHPDKVASAGAELKALAERKTQQINVAYRAAMKARGIDT